MIKTLQINTKNAKETESQAKYISKEPTQERIVALTNNQKKCTLNPQSAASYLLNLEILNLTKVFASTERVFTVSKGVNQHNHFGTKIQPMSSKSLTLNIQ